MFKPFYGYCKFCSEDNQLICVRAGYCQKCNHEQKQAKKKSEGKTIAKYSYVKPQTGEKQLFENIAESREHKCFICNKPLQDLTPSNFMHVLPKALNKYPKYKLFAPNIVLGCHDSYSSCHHRWDKEPRTTLKEEMWNKMFALEGRLKMEYPKINDNFEIESNIF